jgi:hypothetical protein
MAFTPTERDRIREWLAFARIFRDSDPQLAALDVQIDAALGCVSTTEVGKIKQNKMLAVLALKGRQREYVGRIADALSMKPYRDVNSPKRSMPGGDYLANSRTKGGWP